TQGGVRFELELPANLPPPEADEPPQGHEGTTRVMTVLIVEPDMIAQRQLLLLLSKRGHRAVPVTAADEALDVIPRIPFDAVFYSSNAWGLSWIEVFRRARRSVGIFALLTDGFDPEVAKTVRDGEGRIVAKPVQERDLDEVLGLADVRWAVSRP